MMDASSGAAFLREVLALCQKWEAGEPLGKVERLELLPPAEFYFPAAFKGIRRKWNTFKFMLRQMGDEFSYRGGTKGKRQAPIHENGRNKVLTFGLSPEVSDAIIKLSRRMRVTVNDLFNAVLMKAVHLHIYKGEELPFRHFNFADLRPYLKPPLSCDYLGSYFSMMRYTVPMKRDVDIRDLARAVGGIAYSSLKRGDKFSANLLSALMMKAMLRFKAFRMGTTALSYTGSINLETSYGDIKVRGLHAFVSNFGLGPEYTAQVRLFDNCFYWDILYLDSDMDEKQARHIAGKIEALLKEVVA
ncbi:MAG: hypothetical protein GY757_30150 [bacterium]|nr:hypothetical protein [bacterium]